MKNVYVMCSIRPSGRVSLGEVVIFAAAIAMRLIFLRNSFE